MRTTASTAGFDPSAESCDALLGGRLRLIQPRRGFRAGMDSLLLAASVPAREGDSALDLGCGAGAAVLALGVRVRGLGLAGLEVQPAYAALARRNALLNGLGLEVWEGDVAMPPPGLGGRAFDRVLMNPPFFDRRASVRAADPGREAAQGARAPISAWLALAARRLRPGGTLSAIHRVEALPALLGALPGTLGSVAVLPLAPRPGRPPRSVLVRAVKGGRAPFALLAPLALHAAPRHLRDGEDLTPWARAVLRDGAALPWGPPPD
ncbi:tRNA1(Val) (adenine(37)-N6)-methyltransferase [Rubellimicrobium sp. CFH 75288]|uniref:tRNA1(Val) (adenine(37)-N6)-methyltransferase n=1 Tax=Rubellimicrobium sp. CFH 75288 TaxID=2697034 RepID=UPI001FB65D33|nr:methyltransferase [Rubellimicrobium sp. CFH 75288]